MENAITTSKLRKASQAIYLELPGKIADDISDMLQWAADRIDKLESTNHKPKE